MKRTLLRLLVLVVVLAMVLPMAFSCKKDEPANNGGTNNGGTNNGGDNGGTTLVGYQDDGKTYSYRMG
ncbi:MAG: hypothetical protein ACI4SP_04180, partial [Eubacteriales bacterium]